MTKNSNKEDTANARPAFPRGEKKQAAALDPAEEASRAAEQLKGSTKAAIAGYKRIVKAAERFDAQQNRRFAHELVNVRIIPAEEENLEISGSKFSKIKLVGENANVLGHEDVLAFFPEPHLSSLYQVAVLHGVIDGADDAGRLAELVEILKKKSGAITREFLVEETRAHKKEKRRGEKGETPAEGPALEQQASFREVLTGGECVDLALITPAPSILAQLNADYEAGTLQRALPIFKVLKKDAAVVVAGKAIDLPVICNKLMPLCGFSRGSRILLVQEPSWSDISREDILVLAHRGDMKPVLADGQWLRNKADDVDPPAIAARIFPNAVGRLHVFAEKSSDGWTPLIGDNSWVERPAL